MRLTYTFLLIPFFFLAACTSTAPQQSSQSIPMGNPPAEGFDVQGSDPKAVEIADAVMEALGGRSNWDATRYIKWDFFGNRTLTWDKYENRVRIDIPRDSMVILVNAITVTGKVFQGKNEVTHADSLAKYLERGRRIWINDSYWLAMPFKLKDSGVTLTYVGEETTQAGVSADKLELRFKAVGVTPQNKYHVWVDKTSHLITQWAYYANATDAEPRFINPWSDYRTYGKILLSGDRGGRKLENIAVFEELPAAVFESR
ncbi:MAG: hypothetical protein SF052_09970 [Bacteroidia bacterium]|nr:hypothetical protein [Bacteroidia bacterium]